MVDIVPSAVALYNTPQPRPHKEDRHKTDNLLCRNTITTRAHSKILLLYILALTRQHMHVTHVKHFLWSVGRLLMVAIIGPKHAKALFHYQNKTFLHSIEFNPNFTLSLCFSITARDTSSYPSKSTGQITASCTPVLTDLDSDKAAQLLCASLSFALFQVYIYICYWWCTVSTACYPCYRPRGLPFYWTASRTLTSGMKMRVITLRQRIGAISQQRTGSQVTDRVSADTMEASAICTAVSATQQWQSV
jgi:hypothetical protein